jgi:hypothetical protein
VSRRRLTKAQKTLQRLHGTVDEFTDAVIGAIGDISIDEALTAIRDYRARWAGAGFRHSVDSVTNQET